MESDKLIKISNNIDIHDEIDSEDILQNLEDLIEPLDNFLKTGDTSAIQIDSIPEIITK